MSHFSEILAGVLMFGGVFFMLIGSIGLLRMPDFYTRAHAAGKIDTLGIMLFIVGMVVYEGLTLVSAKLALVAVFVALTSPVATHQMTRRALAYGLKPWVRPEAQTGETEEPHALGN